LNHSAVETLDIAGTIRGYIQNRFSVPADDPDFTDDVHLFDYGYIDSFGAVELTMFVEAEFTIKLTEADMVVFPLNTVNQIADFVGKRRVGDI
jgi:acyl carrier protein